MAKVWSKCEVGKFGEVVSVVIYCFGKKALAKREVGERGRKGEIREMKEYTEFKKSEAGG
jgi:hypothetical protein